MNKSRKIFLTLTISLLFILIFMYSLYKLYMDPYRDTVSSFQESQDLDSYLSMEEAQEDLNYLYRQLEKRHPAWLDGSEELVNKVSLQYQYEIENLTDQTSVLELWRSSSRIVSKLSDGHTFINYIGNNESIYIDDFTKIKEYGYPKKINNMEIEKLYEKYLSMASYELEFYARTRFFDNYIVNKNYLRFIGLDIENGVEMLFDNYVESVKFDFVEIDKVKGVNYNLNEEWIYYDLDLDKNLGLLTIKRCIYNDDYINSLKDFFELVNENKIDNIVVDLRGNGGGNSMVANEFLKHIDIESYKTWDSKVRFGFYLHENKNISIKNRKYNEGFNGKIYVLIDNKTFSSAMNFAMLIGDNNIGTLVGETSGNMPSSYGDILYLQMPNSKLGIGISHKKWYRVDLEKNHLPLEADYEVESSKALEKVYELIGLK